MTTEDLFVELAVGEELVVTLEGTSSAGFEWTEHHDASTVEVTGHDFRMTGPQIGASDVDEFRLRGLVPGEHRVEFRYQRPWEGEPRRHIVYRLHVT